RSSADFCSYADAAAAGAEPGFACLTAATDVARTLVAEADSRGSCPGTLDEVGNAICVPFLAAGDPCAPSPPPCRENEVCTTRGVSRALLLTGPDARRWPNAPSRSAPTATWTALGSHRRAPGSCRYPSGFPVD